MYAYVYCWGSRTLLEAANQLLSKLLGDWSGVDGWMDDGYPSDCFD